MAPFKGRPEPVTAGLFLVLAACVGGFIGSALANRRTAAHGSPPTRDELGPHLISLAATVLQERGKRGPWTEAIQQFSWVLGAAVLGAGFGLQTLVIGQMKLDPKLEAGVAIPCVLAGLFLMSCYPIIKESRTQDESQMMVTALRDTLDTGTKPPLLKPNCGAYRPASPMTFNV